MAQIAELVRPFNLTIENDFSDGLDMIGLGTRALESALAASKERIRDERFDVLTRVSRETT